MEHKAIFSLAACILIGNAQAQFLPHAIEWVWRGYAGKKGE